MKAVLIVIVNIAIILILLILFRKAIVNIRKGVKKQKAYYTLLVNWSIYDVDNEKLSTYMGTNNYKKVMIYGAGDLGKVLYKKIYKYVEICAFIEEKPRVDTIESIPVISSKNAKKRLNEVDCVIITPIFEYSKICRSLSGDEYLSTFIPLDELIHNF